MSVSALVIGQGSSGRRHGRLLAELGARVAVVSRHAAGAYRELQPALADERPDYVVVANETAAHAATLGELARLGYRESVLVEKPLFHHPRPPFRHPFRLLKVAYQLRFHPALLRLAGLLGGERIVGARLYVGQHLPRWRPERDYRLGYSASAAAGGGVLRDLSHELDCANWLFGPWRRLAALGGQWSELEIDSDDVFVLLADFDRCPAAAIELNYLDRRGRRELLINTVGHTLAVDLVGGTLQVDGDAPERFQLEPDACHRAMHRAMIEGGGEGLCDVGEAERVLAMIAAAERAAAVGAWVAAAQAAKAACA